jgi:hypothetical protein
VDQGTPPSAAGYEAGCQHAHDVIEPLALEVPVGMGPAHQPEQIVELPGAGGGFGLDLREIPATPELLSTTPPI